MNNALQEFRNHIAVAIANVEAIRDGILEPTPPRCEVILQALTEAEVLLAQVFSKATEQVDDGPD